MQLLVILGTRPQIIKTMPVLKACQAHNLAFTLVHTGQHYDHNLSTVFYQQLGNITPDYWLDVVKDNPVQQMAEILQGLDKIIAQHTFQGVLIPGDTNSALAGAITAFKHEIPLIHLEAGLRSNDLLMQEEINRRLIDHGASMLLCPTQTAVANLTQEHVRGQIHFVGDTMLDNFLQAKQQVIAENFNTQVLAKYNLTPRNYSVITLHRKENTDVPTRITALLKTLDELPGKKIFPMHPRTRARLEALNQLSFSQFQTIQVIEPLPYLEFLALCLQSGLIVTDSGGLQKEAYLMNVPCITMRDVTEWVETVIRGSNMLVGANPDLLKTAYHKMYQKSLSNDPQVYGTGNTSQQIVDLLLKNELQIPTVPML